MDIIICEIVSHTLLDEIFHFAFVYLINRIIEAEVHVNRSILILAFDSERNRTSEAIARVLRNVKLKNVT